MSRKSLRIRIGCGLLTNDNPASMRKRRRIVGVFTLGTWAIPTDCVYATYKINPSPWNGTQPILRRYLRTRAEIYAWSINAPTRVCAFRLRTYGVRSVNQGLAYNSTVRVLLDLCLWLSSLGYTISCLTGRASWCLAPPVYGNENGFPTRDCIMQSPVISTRCSRVEANDNVFRARHMWQLHSIFTYLI